MTDERETTSVEAFTNNNDSDTVDGDTEEIPVEKKQIETREGYELKIKCKRGTGTNDRDEIKQTVHSEDPIEPMEEEALTEQVQRVMAEMRAFQPDEDDE